MAEVDPNTLVLNQILSEIQKLNNFEAQAQRTAQSLASVARADAQTPVQQGLQRNRYGLYTPGGLSTSASTPDVLNQDETQQLARQTANQLADRQTGGQQRGGLGTDPQAEEAVAWSLLSEAGVGGPLGRLRQAQYSVGRNLGAVGQVFGPAGPTGGYQDRLDTAAANAYASGGVTGAARGAVLSGVSNTLTPLRAVGNLASNLQENHELATTIGTLAVSAGLNKAQDWYEQGAALGYGRGQYGAALGVGRALTNAPTTNEGRYIAQTVRQLQGIQSILGGTDFGPAGARRGQGLTKADAQALVGQLFEQGYSAEGTGVGGYFATGNLPEIARGLAPAVQAMGQQGAQIAGSWTQGLRSANDSLSDLTQMLEQMPAAAKASQLGVEQLNQSFQQVAQTVSSMGGTNTEALRIGEQFGQQYPGLHPGDMSGLLQSPIFQAFGLAQGVLPSGLSALPGGQLNSLTQQSVRMVMGALQGLAPAQQYTTLPDGTRVPMNNPQAAVAQQASSQFFPGVNPQDLLKILNQSPQRQQSVSQLQNLLGQTTLGKATGLEYLTGGGHPQEWTQLSANQRRLATEYWGTNIAPHLSQVLSASQIRALNQTGNISRRAELLNQDLYGAKGQGAQQQGNAATVQLQIGLTQKASQILTVNTSAKGHAKRVQNAGGVTLNVPLNSALGQNPVYGGNGAGVLDQLMSGVSNPNYAPAGP